MEGIILKILAASHHLSSKNRSTQDRWDYARWHVVPVVHNVVSAAQTREVKGKDACVPALSYALNQELLNLMSLNSPWNSMGLSALSRDELMLGIQTQIALISQASTFFSAPSGTISGLKVFSNFNGWDYATYSPCHFLSVVIACFLYSELGATWLSSGKGEYKWKRFISSCWKQ